jgi:hypothetical protein
VGIQELLVLLDWQSVLDCFDSCGGELLVENQAQKIWPSNLHFAVEVKAAGDMLCLFKMHWTNLLSEWKQ